MSGTFRYAQQNLIANPAITVHLGGGSEVVIIEGVAETLSDAVLVEQALSLTVLGQPCIERCAVRPGTHKGNAI